MPFTLPPYQKLTGNELFRPKLDAEGNVTHFEQVEPTPVRCLACGTLIDYTRAVEKYAAEQDAKTVHAVMDVGSAAPDSGRGKQMTNDERARIDIVEKLRGDGFIAQGLFYCVPLMKEAASEIERLRDALRTKPDPCYECGTTNFTGPICLTCNPELNARTKSESEWNEALTAADTALQGIVVKNARGDYDRRWNDAIGQACDAIRSLKRDP